jgi:chromosome segregation ATPase
MFNKGKRKKPMEKYPDELPPEVIEHIKGVTELTRQLREAQAQAAHFKEGVETAVTEIRGLKVEAEALRSGHLTEIEALKAAHASELGAIKRMFNNLEERLRYNEKLNITLITTINNGRALWDRVFAEAKAVMATSEAMELREPEDEPPPDPPLPRIVLQGPRKDGGLLGQ